MKKYAKLGIVVVIGAVLVVWAVSAISDTAAKKQRTMAQGQGQAMAGMPGCSDEGCEDHAGGACAMGEGSMSGPGGPGGPHGKMMKTSSEAGPAVGGACAIGSGKTKTKSTSAASCPVGSKKASTSKVSASAKDCDGDCEGSEATATKGECTDEECAACEEERSAPAKAEADAESV